MEYIPKHYLLTNPVFWEEPFIDWKYTKSVLVTAYDLLRNESLLYYLDSHSMTLRELMIERGFPPSTKIFADSGIFSLEWFKLVNGRTFKQDYSNVHLKAKEVLSAYAIIDPDYLCPLDEIILATDKDVLVKEKIEKIKTNTLAALECFPSSRIIGIIQGIREEEITEIFDFEKEQGIRIFARGGLIPLFYKDSYCRIIRFTREITKNFLLHAFGLTKLNQICCYGKCLGIDSFDSTIIRWLTTQFFFLTPDLEIKRFNEDLLLSCSCTFCLELQDLQFALMDAPSANFTKNLYLHNVLILNEYSKELEKIFSFL